MKYTQHPLSAAFPALNEEEFQALKDSIADLGVQNAITIYEGQVLDGWNRYRAASEQDIECPVRELDAWVDPREFVMAQNKARRHLLAAQLIAIASKVYAWKGVGSNQHMDKPATSEPGSESHSEPGSESLISSRELADVVGVTQRSVEQFREVERKAVPEVVDAVERGEMGLRKATAIAQLPEEEQAAAITKPVSEIQAKKFQGKPKKVPAAKLVNAEINAANARTEATQANAKADELGAELEHVRQLLKAAQEDVAHYVQIIDQDKPLAGAIQVINEKNSLAKTLQTRVNSLMTENAELKKSVKHWQRRAEKLEKAGVSA